MTTLELAVVCILGTFGFFCLLILIAACVVSAREDRAMERLTGGWLDDRRSGVEGGCAAGDPHSIPAEAPTRASTAPLSTDVGGSHGFNPPRFVRKPVVPPSVDPIREWREDAHWEVVAELEHAYSVLPSREPRR